MNRRSHARALTHWLCGVFCLCWALAAAPANAAAGSSFDHFTTSFELLGQHKDVTCEACHVGGIFKGTPHDCASCHTTGSRIGATSKPANHILSSNDCSACHTPSGWKPVAMFNHVGMIGSCSSCHNNVQTIGKPANHIPTTLDCGSCHLPTLPWKAANFTHAGITGNCVSCHNGVQAPGKPMTHLPTAEACETCHSNKNFVTWAGTQMVHTGITNGCQSCHETGMSWYGVTMVDRPTVAQDPVHPTVAQGADCSQCHTGFNVGDFNKVKLPANHIPTTATCGQCHTTPGSYAAYVMGTTGHAGITSGCATCHATGKSFLGIAPPALVEPTVGPPAHLPIPGADGCETCHSTTSFGVGGFGPSTPMNHANITSGCQTCHETGMAWKGVAMVDRPTTAKDPNHPTAVQSPDCSTCHSGFAVGDFNKNAKPANHIPTAAACTQCHTAIPNFATYVMGSTGHKGITTGCAACHASGLSFANMAPPTLVETPANHLPIPAADGCETCHSTTNFAVGGFGPSTAMNHANITSGCQACHETGMTWKGVTMVDRPTAAQDPVHPTVAQGADCATCHSTKNFAVGGFNMPSVLPANHMPSSLNCTTCHTAIPTWTTYVMGAAGHAGITSGCANCHAAGKSFLGIAPPALVETPAGPPAHLPIPAADGCETCHSTTNFAVGGFGPSTPMNHAGITSGCQTCHETGMSWKGVTMVDRPTAAQDPVHPTVAQGADCAACHSTSNFAVGAFNTPTVLPANHMPSSLNCTTCHTAIPTWTTYAMGTTGHAGITSGCANCHATGKSFLGIAPPALVEPTIGPPAHLPIPGADGCETCHSTTSFGVGGFGPSTPMNHANITSGCQTCHETGMAWKGVTMVDRPTPAQDAAHPTAAQAPDCAKCHQGFNVGDFAKNAKPLGHIPTTAACAQCHQTPGNFAIYTAGTVLHTGITTGCATCHASGTGPWAGVGGLTFNIKQPPANHLPIPTGVACESCHSTTSFATGGFGPTTPMNHTGIKSGCQACHETAMSWYGVTMVDRPTAGQDPVHPTVAQGADCAACHSTSNFAVGAFNTPTVLPANHMPSSLNCTTCHTAIPTWATYVMGTTGHAGITSGCANCHAAGKSFLGIAPPALVETPAGPPAHLPIPAADGCETCHSTTSFGVGGFGPSTPMNHANITSGCQTCHETGMAWKGVTMVDRPTPAADPNHVTAAQTADCSTSGCHSNSNFAVGAFNIVGKPAGHIPTTATCSQCHTTPGNYSVYTAGATLHTGITTGCATCHGAGTGPWAGVGGLTFTITQPPKNHIPVGTAACEGCHSTSNFTAFSGTTMKHAPVSGKACDSCHEYTMRAANYFYGIALIWHRESASHHAPNDCQTGCHQHSPKDGTTTCTRNCGNAIVVGGNTPVVSIKSLKAAGSGDAATVAPAPTGLAARMSAAPMLAGSAGRPASDGLVDHSTVSGTPCVSCHNGRAAVGKGSTHPRTSDSCGSCHVTLAWGPVLHIDHAEVRGTCVSCHEGTHAVAKPAAHVPTTRDCDACHTTSAWKPAAFDHAGVMQGTCLTCHSAGLATPKPANHPVTTVSCDSCHYALAWRPTKPQRPAAPKIEPRPQTVPPVRNAHSKALVPLP